MEMRVEQLSARADLTVDTIRYYQSKGLLDPPRREGRVAWYGDEHLERLARIRSLQGRGFTLATIVRLVDGEPFVTGIFCKRGGLEKNFAGKVFFELAELA